MAQTKTSITQSTASLSSTGSDGCGTGIVFDEYDERPFLKDLLVENSSAIATVKNAVQSNPLYEPSRYDDIWILRFVLSHKKDTDASSRAAIATMEFRKEHNLNEKDLRGLIKHFDGAPFATAGYGLPYGDKIDICAKGDGVVFAMPDENRDVMQYIFLSKMDMHKITETMTRDDMFSLLIYVKEALHQVLDGITRKTGRLTKLVKFVDFDGMSLKRMSRGYLSMDASVNKELEDFYPQMLAGLLVVHAPKWINGIWKFARPLMPKRVVEKVDFLPSNKEKIQKSLARFVSKKNLLEQYGGENEEWPIPYLGSYFK